MFRSKSSPRGLLAALGVLFAVALFAVGCGGEEDATDVEEPAAPDAGEPGDAAGETDDGAEEPADDGSEEPMDDDGAEEPMDDGSEEPMDDDGMPDPMEEPVEGDMGDGSLGTVTVSPGEAVQIRSLNTISGDVAFLGLPNQRAVELAIADYGQIQGFDVDMGAGLDGLCSAEGGQSTAQQIVADADVVGVIGTSCSGAAVAAAPPITAAGMAMISPSNTSPSLTSDLQGNPNENYNVGYYRTAHNDLFQGEAVARFVHQEMGLASAAAIHDGDPYSEGLATAFKNAFERLGGTVTGVHGISKDDTDMVPLLTEIAASSPEVLFFPIFQPAGDFLTDQIPDVDGLEQVTLITADALLVDKYMELPQSEGIYFAGPDTRYGDNVNDSTGRTASEVQAAYEEVWGESPSAAFWAHAYDATTLLLDAISAASTVADDGSLVIDRAGVRSYLDGVSGYNGLIGMINCDSFGDCGASKLTVIFHESADDIAASKENVVYEFAPEAS